MPQTIYILVLVSLWTLAGMVWAVNWATHRKSTGAKSEQERRSDGGLTPQALEKLIYEQTRLGTRGNRSTTVGFIWEEHEKDHRRLLDLEMALNTERIRVKTLSQELKMTQDALADAVRRLEAVEAGQRGSRLRSLLR